MQNIKIIESNYPIDNSHYNTFQCKLPLDFFTVVPVDDPVTSFVEIMKGINTSKYFNCHHRGNRGYDPNMMLQVTLFAFINGQYELRKMEELCRYDIRYMWLASDETPSFMAFQRFISEKLSMSIEDIFYDVVKRIIELDDVDISKLYIDGTKIEANARKNSFVWKKAILGYQEKTFLKVTDLIIRLNDDLNFKYDIKSKYSADDIGMIAEHLMKLMIRQNIETVYGKGKRRSLLQKYYDEFLEIYIKLMRYEKSLNICGDRNSYSKTDHDATMMNMKYDYYNQTGVFKPGYNLQIGVSDEYIMHMDIFSNPTDTKTYIPFMKKYKKRYGCYPKWPIGDAGYGSYDNLLFNVINGMELGLKYNYYAKKNTEEFKKKIYNQMNWEYDEKGFKVCPQGHSFNIEKEEKWNTAGEYLQISRVFECGKCHDCKVKEKCTKAKEQRKIQINYALNEMHDKVDENLGTEEGKEMKKQRSIQSEGTFGIIKQNMDYVRLKRRGNINVKTELLLIGIAYNIRKYHNKKMKKKEMSIS